MTIAKCNDIGLGPDGRPPRPVDPPGSFLHGLLTVDELFAAGGMRVTDRSEDTTFLPGCCSELEDWRDRRRALDGDGHVEFGHDPAPSFELLGESVRLTVDTEQSDSPVIELPVTELRRLVDGAERDLMRPLGVAFSWVSDHLPGRREAVDAAFTRAFGLPPPRFARAGAHRPGAGRSGGSHGSRGR